MRVSKKRFAFLLLLFVVEPRASMAQGDSHSFPPTVRIFNRTVYWACDDNMSVPSDTFRPRYQHQFIHHSPCNEAPDEIASRESCDVHLPAQEFFLFMHHPNGYHNYFHVWANDYLPLLQLIFDPKKYHVQAPSKNWEVNDKLDPQFVELIERPYQVLTFQNNQQHPHYFTKDKPQIDFLLSLLEKDPFNLLRDKVYCFPLDAKVMPAWFAMHTVPSRRSPGLVWQTQLYVRERIFGLDNNTARGEKRMSETNRKPVLVWVERKEGAARYLYSWKDILSPLSMNFDVRRLDAGRLSPRELVVFMDDADILLGVHGAGLQNMVWMRPFRVVVEIRWPSDKKPDRNFYKMSQHLTHFYSEVECYHLNVTEFSKGKMPSSDQQRVVDAVGEAWQKMEEFHAFQPGRSERDNKLTLSDAKDEL